MNAFARRRRGFTLIEVVGAFMLTIVILVFVTGLFIENGRQREAASALLNEGLSAVSALDLVGADFAGAIFLKRGDEDDPEGHPWRILGASPGDLGSTEVRFVTQAGPTTNAATGSSAWIEVAYFVAEDENGVPVLWRWRSPRPPSEVARDFPGPGDPGAMRVAVGIAAFGVRWLDAEGSWLDEWDSTFAPPEQAMPEAVEISIQMRRRVRAGEVLEDPEADEVAGRLQTRRVALVMRPLDVAALIALGDEGDEEPDCLTVDQCLAEGDSTWYQELLAGNCGGDDRLCEVLRDSANTCWSTIETTYPAIAALAPESCAP